MSEQLVTSAQATIQAITEAAQATAAKRDYWKARALHAEAILAHLRTSLNEQANDPAEDGTPDGK